MIKLIQIFNNKNKLINLIINNKINMINFNNNNFNKTINKISINNKFKVKIYKIIIKTIINNNKSNFQTSKKYIRIN